MIAVFRVDASTQIGSGHVMRCLTLAQRLNKEKQAEVYFVMRLLEGNLIKLVKDKGFTVLTLPETPVNNDLQGYAKWLTVTQKQDAKDTIDAIKELQDIDLLIVDSYAIDYIWENELRLYVKQIMVIDDLANRKHNCDILLDQNFYLDKEKRYKKLVPENCQLYLGPKFALLRDEFYKVKANLRKRDGNIKNILVFFGGSDLTNETEKAIKAIELLNKPDITVNVLPGNAREQVLSGTIFQVRGLIIEIFQFCIHMKWVMKILFGKCQINIWTGIQNVINQSTDQRKFKQKFRCFGLTVRNLIQHCEIFRVDHHDSADNGCIIFACHDSKRTG